MSVLSGCSLADASAKTWMALHAAEGQLASICPCLSLPFVVADHVCSCGSVVLNALSVLGMLSSRASPCRLHDNYGWMAGPLCPFMVTRVSKRGIGCLLSSRGTRAPSCWQLMWQLVVLVGQNLPACKVCCTDIASPWFSMLDSHAIPCILVSTFERLSCACDLYCRTNAAAMHCCVHAQHEN